jgi:hypothetical protein
VRAENGFGRSKGSANDALADGRGPSVVLTARQPAVITQRAENTNAGAQAMRTQRVRVRETIGADPADRQKARKANKGECDNERKGKKRDRHNGRQRNR